MSKSSEEGGGSGSDAGTDAGWDDVVDVICVGTRPGVLAYAICCAAADLDVLIVALADDRDPQIDALYSAMTEDLGDPAPELTVAVSTLTPLESSTGGWHQLEPFIGEHLRQWSAQCLAAPTGVMFTQVSRILEPMRTDAGESVTAATVGGGRPWLGLEKWLVDRALELDLIEPGTAPQEVAQLVVEGGRIAGVQLADGGRIAATEGLALPVGPTVPVTLPDLPDGEHQLAVVGRRVGRFARLELAAERLLWDH